MPVLPAEPRMFPPDLFRLAGAASDDQQRWHVLHTRPRQEKALARQLYAEQIPFYLPLTAHCLRLHGHMLTAHLPLFPGYVFLRATREERWAVRATQRVVWPLEVPDQAGLWRDRSSPAQTELLNYP